MFGIFGFFSTCEEDKDLKNIFLAIAIVGLIYGIGTVLISLIEAKSHRESLIVILDLLLMVVTYTAVYCAIYSINNSSFNIKNQKNIYLDLLYYSFITLTTTGYGDIVPVSYGAKFLSASESFAFACIISIVIMNYTKEINNGKY